MSPAQEHGFGHAVFGGVAVVTLARARYLSDSQTAFLEALRRARAAATAGRIVVDFSRAEMVTSGPSLTSTPSRVSRLATRLTHTTTSTGASSGWGRRASWA